MATPNEYIFFEADQVLTNDHLNETFSYLDQQNRWTRNKLIGIGIACGLNISHQAGIIAISGGCGVTSQGYLILQPAPRQYAYIIPYTPVDLPDKLPFDHASDLPFFATAWKDKGILLLLTDGEYELLEEAKKTKAQTLSSQAKNFLNDYVVVLFLEANEVDLKNCDTFDCTNKGERIQFNVKPLLIKKTDIRNKDTTDLNTNTSGAVQSHQIRLKRYNVPYADLKNHVDVIKAFVALVDDETLQEVGNALNYCYQQYGGMLGIGANAFANLFNDLQTRRTEILTNYPIFIQYFYDFINDLIEAYYEFRIKLSEIITRCCPDENLFPLHLVLGDAALDTDVYTKDSYRTYFIYSPLFAKGIGETGEAAFLYRRMEIMVNNFEILISTLRERSQAIKITPSQYGLPLLSERAIPYYYNVMAGSTPLYKSWNYYKTNHGNAGFNQSYNAYLYNTSSVMVQPLLYDIEHYNFFRIEGHIGENYQSVLKNLLNQRLEYNLPFDVVAISADLLRSNATLPECNMQDLETDYKLILSEFACKVHTPFCFLTQFPYPPDAAKTNLNQPEAMKAFSAFKMEAGAHFNSTSPTTHAVYTNYSATAYRKGDFMRTYCMPQANSKTIGSYYLQRLKSGNFNVDTIQEDTGGDQTFMILIYNYILLFIDAVEELMLLLHTNSAATLSITSIKDKYAIYQKALYLVTGYLTQLVSGKDAAYTFVRDLELDVLVDEFFMLSTICIDERLQTLVEEYRRRLFLYQSQHTFLNYFKKHPGLEHKAGVPKGGTFVIVYYENTFYQRGEVASLNSATTAHADTAQKEIFFSEQMLSKQYYLNNDAATLIADFVKNCTDAPEDSKQKIIDIIDKQRKPATDTKFSITNGAVIADFYIPYLCCSDCPPVAYIIQSPPDEGYITIHPSFLYDDTYNYPFDTNLPLTPDDFKDTTSNPGGLNLLMVNGILNLHPDTDIQETLQIYLQYKDIKVPITIVVPNASFTINIQANAAGEPTITVAAKHTDANNYEWLVNDKEAVFDKQANPAAIALNDFIKVDPNANEFIIELIVTYVINDNTSTDNKKGVLTRDLIDKNLNKGPFEPVYKQEDVQ